MSCLGWVKPETLLKQWGQVLIDSIQEVMPMINDFMDFITVLGFFIFMLKKIIESVPPRLLEVL